VRALGKGVTRSVGGQGGPQGAGDLARQHGGGPPLDDVKLKRLIQEAVDEALARIAKGEGATPELAAEVEARARERVARDAETVEALHGRVAELERRLRTVDDRHGRVEARVEDLSLHVGQREPVEVSRVPPEILERSFQAALDDLVGELAKVKGRDELERTLDEAVADLRGRSKGSELFERQEGRILIRGLGAAVAKKLLSPKAAQATFDEVFRHLRAYVPAYKPRSLAAILRARASDFAVESAVVHHDRLTTAESTLRSLLEETRRIEREAKAADQTAAEGVSRSFMQAVSERRTMADEFQGRIRSLEVRASEAEARLEKALSRLDSVERYASRVESAMIRRTKEGTFKGDFTPVIEAVHEALKDGKPRTMKQLAARVKGVEAGVVESVVREGLREGAFEQSADGKVRRAK